jgi:hypothetical protein
VLGAVLLSGAPVLAADGAPIRVMLIATYHFSNPGQDLNNVKSVDVLAPQRQRELEAVTQSLARFEPNSVAVEWPDDIVDERYPKFMGGTLAVSRNEVVQLGFRLASARKLKLVRGLDVDGDFPFDPVVAWASSHGRQTEIDRMLALGAAEVTRISALQEKHSIGGVLRDMNPPAAIAKNHSFYPTLLSMGEGTQQPGAALVSAWYSRNLAICARLMQAARAGDRIAVFYGQGHVYLLRQCLSEQSNVELVDALDYLPRA